MGSINFKSLFWGYSTTLLLQSAYGTEPNFGKEREADGRSNSFLDTNELYVWLNRN